MTIDEKLQVAQDAYEFIKDSTTGPKDAAEVILMMHVTLWLNYHDDTCPPETMLVEYNKSFIENYRRNLNA